MKTTKQLFSIVILTLGVLFQIHAQDPFTNGLVAYYPFNGNANDESGLGRNDIIYGDTTLTYDRFGISGRAYAFDGADDWLRALSPINDVTNNFTMTIWFKASEEHRSGEFGPFIILASHGVGTWGDSGVGAGISAGTNLICVWEHTHDYNPKVIQLTGYFPDWTMVTLIYSNRIPFLYTNGILAAVGNQSLRSPVRPSNGQSQTTPLYGNIEGGVGGYHQVGGGGSSFFKGRLDDIRIYNRVLSDSEVRQLYDFEFGPWVPPFTNGLAAFYPFNGNANDESGNGNTGTANAATLAVDRFGITNSAYAFDGVSSFITVPDSPSLRIPGDITVACWVNLASTPFRGTRFVGKGIGCGKNYGLWLDKPEGPDFYWMFQQFPPEGGCIGCQENTASSTPIVTVGKWYHVIGVRSGNVSRLYVDGVLLGDADAHPENCSPTTYTGSEPLRMGEPGEPTASFMHGSLDDIRIYNRALSSSQVQQLYEYESGPRVSLIKAVKPAFSGLSLGANYQLQVSGDMNNWTNQGSAFTATNIGMIYPQYWDVDNWGSLFFRLQVSP